MCFQPDCEQERCRPLRLPPPVPLRTRPSILRKRDRGAAWKLHRHADRQGGSEPWGGGTWARPWAENRMAVGSLVHPRPALREASPQRCGRGGQTTQEAASRTAGSEHGAQIPPLTWVVGTRAPAPQAEAIPGRLWQSPKSRRLKPQPRRLASRGRSLPCRRPPHAAAAYPAVLLLTKALAPSGQGRPGTVSDLSRVSEAQSPWTVGTPPAAGLSCDVQWRRDAAGVWGGFTPGRTTETGHRLSWETFPAARHWVCGHRGTWGQPDRSLPGHTGASDGSGLRATHAPGMEGGWQADPQPSRVQGWATGERPCTGEPRACSS